MKKIILISGKMQSGKTESSKILKGMLELKGERVFQISYANYLKYLCQKHFNWDGQKDLKGRTILQEVGDTLRKNNEDIFCNIMNETIFAVDDLYDYVIVDDCRFLNEVETMKYEFNNILTILSINR